MSDQPSIIKYFNSELFLTYLRKKKGYSIGVEEYQEVNRLLLGLAAIQQLPTTIDELARVLGPLLCKTTRQQRTFAAELTAWITPLLPAPDLPPPPKVQIREVIEDKRKKTFPWRLAFLILVVLAVLIATYFAATSSAEATQAEPQAGTPATVPEGVSAFSLRDYLRSLFFEEGGLALSLPEHWQWYVGALGLLAILASGVWLAIRRILSRVPDTFLRRMPRDPERPFDINRFFLPTPDRHSFLTPGFVRTAKKFNNPIYTPSAEIDTEKTLEATLRKGGHFEIIQRLVPRSPEYLVLIDRKAFADHQAAYVQVFIDTLASFDVPTTVLYFDGDPRNSYSEERDRVYDLQALAKSFGNYNLLIFSSARELLDERNLEPATWVKALAQWPEAALFTPETLPPASAAYRVLEEHFELYPATWLGLEVFVSTDKRGRPPGGDPLPGSLSGRTGRWLDEHPPDEPTAAFLLSEVRDYLGPAGFLWLCACSVYPALNWHLTLTLGQKLYGPDGLLFHHDRLLRLIQLPWFRYGRLPDWLRLQLLESLPEKFELQVRQVIYDLFVERTLEPAGSFHLEFGHHQRPGYRFFARRLLRTWQERTAPETGVNDFIFTSFMEDRLAVRIPQKVRPYARPAARKEKKAPSPLKSREASGGLLGLPREYWETMGLALGAHYCFALLTLIFFADIHQTGINTPAMATIHLFALALAPLLFGLFDSLDKDGPFQKYYESPGIVAGLLITSFLLMIPWKYISYLGWFFLIFFFGLYTTKILAFTRLMLSRHPTRMLAGYLGLSLCTSLGLGLAKLTPLIPLFASSENTSASSEYSFAMIILAFILSLFLTVLSSLRTEVYAKKYSSPEAGMQPWPLPFSLRSLSPRDPDRLFLLAVVLVVVSLSGFSTVETPFLSAFEMNEVSRGISGTADTAGKSPVSEQYLIPGLKLGSFLAGGLLCFLIFGLRRTKASTLTLLNFLVLGLIILLGLNILHGMLSRQANALSDWLLLLDLPHYFAAAMVMGALLHLYARLSPYRHLELIFGIGFLGYTLLTFLRRLLLTTLLPQTAEGLAYYLVPALSLILPGVLFLSRRRLAALAYDGTEPSPVMTEADEKVRESRHQAIRQAQTLVREGKPVRAIDVLQEHLAHSPAIREEWTQQFTLLRHSFLELNQRYDLGMLSSEEGELGRNRLTQSLLELVDTMENDLRPKTQSRLLAWWRAFSGQVKSPRSATAEITKLKTTIETAVTENRQEEALERLRSALENSGPFFQEYHRQVLMLSARVRQLKREELNAVISAEEAWMRWARINQAILQLTTAIQQVEKTTSSRWTRWRQGLSALFSNGRKTVSTPELLDAADKARNALGGYPDRPDKALQILEEFLRRNAEAFPDLYQEAILHSARAQQLRKRITQWLISEEQARIQQARISQAVSELIREMIEKGQSKTGARGGWLGRLDRFFRSRRSRRGLTEEILPILLQSRMAVGEGEPRRALRLLLEFLAPQGTDSEPYQDLLTLEERLKVLERDSIRNVISNENYRIGINQVNYALVTLIDQLETQVTGAAAHARNPATETESPALSDLYRQVRDLIARDEMWEALNRMEKGLSQRPPANKDLLSQLTVIRARFSNNEQKTDRGMLPKEDYLLERNRIRAALMDLLREAETATAEEESKEEASRKASARRSPQGEKREEPPVTEQPQPEEPSGREPGSAARELIARGDTGKAITLLLRTAEAAPEAYRPVFDQLLMLAKRWEGLRREQARATISQRDAGIETARITHALLELLNEIDSPEREEASGTDDPDSAFQRTEAPRTESSEKLKSAIQPQIEVAKKLIGQGEIEASMEVLEKMISSFPLELKGRSDELILLKAQWYNLRENRLRGTISDQQAGIEEYRIREALLNFIRSLEA